jgi:hypothetical protein
MRRTRSLVLAAVAVLLLASCDYADLAQAGRDRGDPVPWWCDPKEEIPVTEGPAAGTVDWYAGTHKAPLSWDQCMTLSAQFDQAREWALQWPTAGAAESDGWARITPFIPGMGTHHVRGGVTPAMLNDPGFDRLNPILDAVGLDGVFDPTKPDVLQYDGNGANAKLVGFDYYVRTNTGLPPAGFPGNNDWWHHHPWICHSKTTAAQIGFNISDSQCTSMNGVNVNLQNYYMLHVWVLEDMVYTPDVYAGMIPCITGSGTVHDPTHWCHRQRTASGGAPATAMDGMDHTIVVDPEAAGGASVPVNHQRHGGPAASGHHG